MEQADTHLESELRIALARAEGNNTRPLGYPALLPHVKQLPVEAPGTMIVERLPINRVDIKIEVSAFIEHHFLSRTANDGSIISLSKESLIEELTGLFYALEERSSQIEDVKVKKPIRKSSPEQRESTSN